MRDADRGAATSCAIIGAIPPLIPATPFLLVAGWALAKSSPRFHGWLVNHPRFGPLITNGNATAASIRRPSLALVVMAATFCISLLRGVPLHVLAIQAVALAGSAIFILTRPDGPSN